MRLRLKYGQKSFSPMSVHKELDSLWLTLVAFFDPKHFLVEKVCRDGFIS
jgi:hypothetical protein